jgi:hypothetical protein
VPMQERRPHPCPTCGLPVWWNGSRVVGGESRRRARCSDRQNCDGKGWTVYDGDVYPRRSVSLAVVASAVAAAATKPDTTLATIAQEHDVSRSSVSRWIAWLNGIFDVGSLVALVARLDPSSPFRAPPRPSGGGDARARAGWTLYMFERFADGLVQRGVRLPAARTGLARILRRQLDVFRDLFHLVSASPPTVLDFRCLPP